MSLLPLPYPFSAEHLFQLLFPRGNGSASGDSQWAPGNSFTLSNRAEPISFWGPLTGAAPESYFLQSQLWATMLLAPSLFLFQSSNCMDIPLHTGFHRLGLNRRTHSTQTSSLSLQSMEAIICPEEHSLAFKQAHALSLSHQAQLQRSLLLPYLRHIRYTKDFCGQRNTS